MQQDAHKTNTQLLDELRELRQRNIELETSLANSKEAEEHLRAVSETALDAVIISDQEGNIIFWNKTATEIFGYKKEEVLGNPITMLISDEAMGEYNEGKEHLLERGFSLFGKRPKESVAKRKDGTKFPAELTVSNWKIKDKYYFGGSLRDISEQKRIEKEYERILNMSQDLICIAATDGYFKYVNPAWERTLGYPSEHLLARPFLDFIHPEDHQKNDDEVARLVAGMLTVDFENRYIHKDGSIRIVQWTAAPLPEKGLWYCIGRDITERKQHEEALQESEERFRAVVESSSDAILITDQNGTITFWNRASAEMFGYEERGIVGKSYTNLLPERLWDQDQKAWQQFFKTGMLSHNKIPFETLALRKNGSEFPIEITFSGWKVQGQYCFSFIVRDITERKQAEEALENSESRYRELFNNSKNALVIYEAIDDGRDFIFKEFNHAAENIEQLKKEALIGKFLTEAFPGVKEFGLLEVLRRVWKTGKPEEYPVAFYQDERISGWRDNYVYKLPSGEIVVIYEDITKRKRVEKELINTKDFLENIYNTTPDVMMVSDEKGYVISVNKAVEKMLGFNQEELIGKHTSELFPDDEKHAQIGAKIITVLRKKGVIKSFEANWLRKDGSLCPIELNITMLQDRDGNRAGGVATIRDITERKQQEEALREREERFRTISESSLDAIITTDSSGEILYCNKSVERIYGYTAEELMGKSIAVLEPAALRPISRKKGGILLKDGHSSYIGKTAEGIGIRKDGSEVAVEVSSSHWKIGDEIIFAGIVRDITQRKQMEEQLRKSHAELEKKVKQRTAELREANEKLQISQEYLKKFSGKLLSVREEERKNISTTLHDELGSMAISVTSKISIAKEDVKNNNRKAALKTLEEGQSTLRKAVDDLRRLAVDLRPPNLEILGLNTALTDFIDKAKEQAKLKITFRDELGNKKTADDRAIVIYRVTQEAITNIAKHAKAKNVRVRLYSDRTTIHLEITDDGVGFNQDRVIRSKGNLKIGIQGMRERVESLGGEFIITSAPRQGTQLKAALPKK